MIRHSPFFEDAIIIEFVVTSDSDVTVRIILANVTDREFLTYQEGFSILKNKLIYM